MLNLANVRAGYNGSTVLHDVSLRLKAGQCMTILGPNGAGKSTLLKAIAGLIEVQAGRLHFNDEDITDWPIHRRVRNGIGLVPEGRELFSAMTTMENLRLAARERSTKHALGTRLSGVLGMFPDLRGKLDDPAGLLSGGQQQMIAVGRALIPSPRLLLLDEPSTGLAPKFVETIWNTVGSIKSSGVSVLIVEHSLGAHIELADWVMILAEGRVEYEGPPSAVVNDDKFVQRYFGLGPRA